MNIFTKAKILVETYLLQKSSVPIKEANEAKLPILDQQAPVGRKPFSHSVQNDGALIRTEPDESQIELSDEQALRDRKGNSYADRIQQKASTILEEISRLEMLIRDLIGFIQDLAVKQAELLQNTPDYHYARGEVQKNRSMFFAVVSGEIVGLIYTFGDFFGLDFARIASDIYHQLPLLLAAVIFSFSFFAATYLIAKKALYSGRQMLWMAALITIAVLTAKMRAEQVGSLQDTGPNLLFIGVLYTVVGIILPLAAAHYGKNWEEAFQVAGSTDSIQRRLNEQAAEYTSRIQEANRTRTQLIEQLDQITDEFVKYYQEAIQKKERAKRDWEVHKRYVEAYISQMRYCYNFWSGWNASGMTMPKLVKRGLQATALILLVLIITLSSCHMAHAENQFNLLAVCDRSSSASGISCTSETLKDAGIYWIGRADEAGGGILEVFLIDQGFDTAVILFSAEYPEKFPGPVSLHKKKWRNTFLHRLTDAMESLPTNKGSSVVEAIYRASLRIPDGGETLLYIMSDLREQNTVFNFEKNVPSEKEFLHWLEISSIKPTFNASTNILVCGIHPYTPAQTSRMTTENYNRLLKLWRSVFTQWGVKADINEACSLKRKG